MKQNISEEQSTILEYPLLRQTDKIDIVPKDIEYLEEVTKTIGTMPSGHQCEDL